jgi:hypothetical protein
MLHLADAIKLASQNQKAFLNKFGRCYLYFPFQKENWCVKIAAVGVTASASPNTIFSHLF